MTNRSWILTSKKTEPKSQRDRFIEKARELGCDEDEARFNATLKRVAAAKPAVAQAGQKDAGGPGDKA